MKCVEPTHISVFLLSSLVAIGCSPVTATERLGIPVTEVSRQLEEEHQAIVGFWIGSDTSTPFEIVEVDKKLQITITRHEVGRITLNLTRIEPNKYSYPGLQKYSLPDVYLTLQHNRLTTTPDGGKHFMSAFRIDARQRLLLKSPVHNNNQTVYFPRTTITSSEFVGQDRKTFYPPYGIDLKPVSNREFLEFVNFHSQWKKNKIPEHLHNGAYLKHWQNDETIEPKEINGPVRYVSYYAASAFCEALGKVLPRLHHFRIAVNSVDRRMAGPDDEPYPALELKSIRTEWTNSWPSSSLFESHRYLYDYKTLRGLRLEVHSRSRHIRDEKKRYTSGLLGFRCVTLFEP